MPGGFAPPDPPARSLAGTPMIPAPLAWLTRCRSFASFDMPGGFAPPDPPARSLAGTPMIPAPLAWLTRCRSFASFDMLARPALRLAHYYAQPASPKRRRRDGGPLAPFRSRLPRQAAHECTKVSTSSLFFTLREQVFHRGEARSIEARPRPLTLDPRTSLLNDHGSRPALRGRLVESGQVGRQDRLRSTHEVVGRRPQIRVTFLHRLIQFPLELYDVRVQRNPLIVQTSGKVERILA